MSRSEVRELDCRRCPLAPAELGETGGDELGISSFLPLESCLWNSLCNRSLGLLLAIADEESG